MRYLSMFSGIEAATVAWHPLGWECAAVCEVDPFPCKVLKHHYPDVPNLGDVTKITEEQIKQLGHIDVVVFGSPCQDLSVAGHRKGLINADGTVTRSGLFFTAINIAKWSGARFWLWENVPGAFSSSKGRDFASVVEFMAGLDEVEVPVNGWGTEGVALGDNGLVEWGVLDAQWFGVAQRRRRVFALLDTGNWADRSPILLEPEGVRGNNPPRRETRKSVAGATGQGVEGSSESEVAKTLVAHTGVSYPDTVNYLPVVNCHEVAPTLNAAFGSKMGLEDQHIFSGAGLFVTQEGDEEDVIGTITARMFNALGARDVENGAVIAVSESGDIASTLRTGGNDHADVYNTVAYGIPGNWIGRAPENGGNATDPMVDVSPCQTGVDRHAVAYSIMPMNSGKDYKAREVEVAQPVMTGGSVGGNQGGDIVVSAFDLAHITSKTNRSTVEPGMPSPTIGANSQLHVASFTTKGNGDCFESDVHPTLSIGGGQAGQGYPAARIGMHVRRLTCVECERLQGFPDGYTDIMPGGKKTPDGPRYKALGNSMAVPVMRWIGEQIQRAVDGAKTTNVEGK